MLHDVGGSDAPFVAPTATFVGQIRDALRAGMKEYPATQWRFVDTPYGHAQAIRGTFFYEKPDMLFEERTPTKEEREICPLAFLVILQGIIFPCNADNWPLFAYRIGIGKNDAYALVRAIDGVPGHDPVLREAIEEALCLSPSLPPAA